MIIYLFMMMIIRLYMLCYVMLGYDIYITIYLCYISQVILICNSKMIKDLSLGNKIINKKIYLQQRKRHHSKLLQIKNRTPNNNYNQPNYFKPLSIHIDSDKNLQIQKNNIVLFNRIASILKERPKIQIPKSRSFVKSIDDALINQEKKMQQLKIKQEMFNKRIKEQKATINNQANLKDRYRQEKYLKNIGKYPFNRSRRTHTDLDITQQELNLTNHEVFTQKSHDFQISIRRDNAKGFYIFIIEDLMQKKQHRLEMQAQKFHQQLGQCKLSYERMIRNLRMEKNGDIWYMHNGQETKKL